MKTCTHPNCKNRVFSHGKCRYHYVYKPKSKITQVSLFNKIWNERPHVSELSDEPLECYYGTKLWFSCFIHILPKSHYPGYKYSPENILLGTPKEHDLIDKGTLAQREAYNKNSPVNWAIYYDKYEYLKRMYNSSL